ncbi:FAD-dependent oxidoreductase [Brachybacterium sp. DNPG3]
MSPQQSARQHVDVLVIGWGKAGKTLAGTLARAGRRVAVVEQSEAMIGGSCINIACIPTKILIHDAEQRREGEDPDAVFAAAVARRDTLTGAMRAKNRAMLADLDEVLLVGGHAEFAGEREVIVTGGDEELTLTADTVVINTGSVARMPDVPGARLGGRVHDSETLQHITPRPASLLVVGAGYVGLEFASMFGQFGTQVTVLGRGRRLLPKEDADVAAAVASALADAGVELVDGAAVTAIEDGEEEVRVRCTIDGEERTFAAEAVLLATGRAPATVGLGLERAGVRTDEAGFVVVDAHLRTTADGVFAAGDVTGGEMFTYLSLDDHRILADQLLRDGERRTTDRVAVPYSMFTTPPLSRVGITEQEARAQGLAVRVGQKAMADVAAAPRAKIEGDPRGLLKLVVDAETDLILGAALLHVHSTEVINTVALAMRHDVTAAELRDAIYTHPSATEALNEVLGALR